MEQANSTPLSVLIIAHHDPMFDWIQLALQEQYYNIIGHVNSVEQALRRLSRTHVDIVLADTSGENVLGVEWMQQLSLSAPGTLILVIATAAEMDFVREAMLAGAQGFLLKPFDLADLSRSIEQVHQLWLQRHTLLHETKQRAASKSVQTIALFSPKGGTGVTSLAVNLAIALRQQTNMPVLLVDADLNAADVDVFLNVFSERSILDLLELEREIDMDLLERIAAEHSTGIRIIRGDANLQFIETPIEPGQMSELMEGLTTGWDGYIVINTGNNLDRWTIEILDVVDTVLLVTTPELPALRAMRNFLELAEAQVDESDKWQLVMNAFQSRKVLRMNDVEESIHYPVKITISQDTELVATSINRGTPLLLSHSKSVVAKDIIMLAKQLIEANPSLKKAHSAKGAGPSSAKEEKKRFSFRQLFRNTLRPSNKLKESVS
jgi:pilus assembly protein CpaE